MTAGISTHADHEEVVARHLAAMCRRRDKLLNLRGPDASETAALCAVHDGVAKCRWDRQALSQHCGTMSSKLFAVTTIGFAKPITPCRRRRGRGPAAQYLGNEPISRWRSRGSLISG